jgi:nitrogen fixation/metabolism regulation signal transduction histidine kinase
MLLVRDGDRVIFGNVAARQLLNRGRRLEGMALAGLLERTFASLREAFERGGDALFTVRHPSGSDAEDDIYHLARRQFMLNGRNHELVLLRHLTAELRRQEVQTWKKVIRVISHELNNSLAPVASLARSGAQLVERGQTERLPEILKTIEERTRHLERFIEGYARFAKLPAPRVEPVEWGSFIGALQSQVEFSIAGTLPQEPVRLDSAQMEQALLNVIKNAHESGSPTAQVCLCVQRSTDLVSIEVSDRGSGMSDVVMSNAVVPFYSTKRSGTGLGLALTREIVEAHGGRIALHNRPGGGLSVTLILPA